MLRETAPLADLRLRTTNPEPPFRKLVLLEREAVADAESRIPSDVLRPTTQCVADALGASTEMPAPPHESTKALSTATDVDPTKRSPPGQEMTVSRSDVEGSYS